MVKDLDRALDRHLLDTPRVAEAIPEILAACERMRFSEPSSAVEYWLGAIERHALAIANPSQRTDPDAQFLGSLEFLRFQLLRDIYYLRLQLTNSSPSAH